MFSFCVEGAGFTWILKKKASSHFNLKAAAKGNRLKKIPICKIENLMLSE